MARLLFAFCFPVRACEEAHFFASDALGLNVRPSALISTIGGFLHCALYYTLTEHTGRERLMRPSNEGRTHCVLHQVLADESHEFHNNNNKI